MCVSDDKIPNARKKYLADRAKFDRLQNFGQLIIMRECTWNKMKCEINFPATALPRILLKDTEASLLEAIQNESIFGFVLCDVETPEEIRSQFGSFLFPPIIQKMEIDESYLSPYMLNIAEKEGQKVKRTTLVQTYNCKQQLFMSPLIKMYLDRGLIVRNITKFIQARLN